jgi:hypothetical protein
VANNYNLFGSFSSDLVKNQYRGVAASTATTPLAASVHVPSAPAKDPHLQESIE